MRLTKMRGDRYRHIMSVICIIILQALQKKFYVI